MTIGDMNESITELLLWFIKIHRDRLCTRKVTMDLNGLSLGTFSHCAKNYTEKFTMEISGTALILLVYGLETHSHKD